MNKIITLILISSAAISLNAQTNSVSSTNSVSGTNTIASSNIETNSASGKTYGSIELTLGGGGLTVPNHGGTTEFGIDVSIDSNFIKKFPSLYLGVAQSIAWEPSFAGSTDIFADWSTDIWKQTLYLNTGWSGGAVYDKHSTIYRTGPEVSLQYYTSDNAFIYAGINYDIAIKHDNNIRYSLGIGITF